MQIPFSTKESLSPRWRQRSFSNMILKKNSHSNEEPSRVSHIQVYTERYEDTCVYIDMYISMYLCICFSYFLFPLISISNPVEIVAFKKTQQAVNK